VYHCVNAGCATRFEFAEEILHRGRDLGLVTRTVTLTPVATADYPTRATRPANSCLDTGKLRSVVGVSMRNWREALQEYLRELRDASAGRSMP
jgi:dTDP-4-dehydrorhamnose reductase